MSNKITTQITVNGIVVSTSYDATSDDPCHNHTGNFTSEGGEYGDLNGQVYDELSEAWNNREDGANSVTIGIDGDEITLGVIS